MNEADELFLVGIENLARQSFLEMNLVDTYCREKLTSTDDIETLLNATLLIKNNMTKIQELIDKIKSEEFV